MALQKTIMTPYGIPATYWRILRQEVTFQNNDQIFVAGYADEKARRDGSQPLMVITQQHDLTDKSRSDIYPILKASKMGKNMDDVEVEFNLLVGATDVLDSDTKSK